MWLKQMYAINKSMILFRLLNSNLHCLSPSFKFFSTNWYGCRKDEFYNKKRQLTKFHWSLSSNVLLNGTFWFWTRRFQNWIWVYQKKEANWYLTYYVYLCLSIIPIISEAVPSDPSDQGGGDLVTVINQVRLYW